MQMSLTSSSLRCLWKELRFMWELRQTSGAWTGLMQQKVVMETLTLLGMEQVSMFTYWIVESERHTKTLGVVLSQQLTSLRGGRGSHATLGTHHAPRMLK